MPLRVGVTAVKRVSFSDEEEIVCIPEQRMGNQGAICIFNVHRDGDGPERACIRSLSPSC